MKTFLTLCVTLTFFLLPEIALCIPDLTAPKLMDVRAVKLGLFFDKYKCPTLNYQLIDDYINAADRYQIPYNLLPAISIQESTCGKHFPVHTANLWGWNSAKSGFADLPQGVDFVSERLANGRYYANKSITKKLNAYNPNPEYAPKILRFMAEIENQ